MRRAILFAAAAAVLWVAAVTFVVVDTAGGRSSLLQGDGLSVPQQMERFGRQLEREGVRGAGAQLAMEGGELARQQLSYTRDSNAAQNGAYTPAKPGEVQYAPELGGTNGVFSQSNGGGNGWARRPKAASLRMDEAGEGAHSVVQEIEAERSHPRRPKLMLQPKLAPNAPRPQVAGGQWWEAPHRSVPLQSSGLMLQPKSRPGKGPDNAAGIGALGLQRKAPGSEGQWWDGEHREAPLKATGLKMVKLEEGGEGGGGAAEGGEEGEEDESPVEAAEEAAHEHEQVATGRPGAYDGAYGAQFKKNAGGHEGAMVRGGVNVDDYPLDIYKGVPFFAFDPAATTQRAMSQRAGAGSVAEPYKVTSGKRAGHEVWPAGWGQLNEGSEGGDRLRRGGVVVDRWPISGEQGFPNPAWDRQGYDQEAGLNIAKPMDAKAVVEEHRRSQAKAEAAGIKVNGFPMGDGKDHEYNSIDGMLDTLVKQDAVPKFRKEGVASQERPLHFLLDDDANGKPEGQGDAIGKVWVSGRLDERPQFQENREEGVEFDPSNPAHEALAGDGQEEEEE